MSFQKWKRPALIALALSLVLSLGILTGYVTRHVFSVNGRFEDFTEELFCQELTGSTLNLHYTLAHPQKYGLSKEPVTLGQISCEDLQHAGEVCQDYLEALKEFPYEKLSKENQLTMDLLLLTYRTKASLDNHYILEEVLSPSLGIQAQLPVLLAEYPFYTESDITDYLRLLTCVRPYFESILVFEQEKADQGVFMSDTSLDRILAQCQSFLQDPSSNYLTQIFEEKLETFGKLTKEEHDACIKQHEKILRTSLLPAYKRLMEGLEALRGRGKASHGLAYDKGGREYYQYLIQSQVGSYTPIPNMEKRMYQQLLRDSQELSALLKANPDLPKIIENGSGFTLESPEDTLNTLREAAKKDFPPLGEVSYEVKYVHPSMEDFLSPAFYLTPPIDTCQPNVIYINNGSKTSDLELFATLGHEGFPGHLYQTQFFNSTDPSPIRQLFTCGGYIEGWATYTESFAYSYAPGNSQAARAVWLNRCANLCLYSLLDIGIHYHGWNQAATAQYLSVFGINNPDAAKEIFQYIVETPANYLRYYWGYLSFLDLQEKARQAEGDQFDLPSFHRKVLEIGPVPFPILEKYLLE